MVDISQSNPNNNVPNEIQGPNLPLPVHSQIVLNYIFAFYSYSDQVIDLFQQLSSSSRVYARSQSMATMRLWLTVHKWSPHSHLPMTLTDKDVKLEKRSKYSRENRNIEGMLQIWNNEGTNLVLMAQQLAD